MFSFLKKLSGRKLISRLLRQFIAPYKGKLLIAFFFMILAAFSTAALPYLLKDVFDDVFSKADVSLFIFVCGGIFLAFLVKGAASYGESVVMTYIGQKIISDIQNKLFKHLTQADLAFFHKTSTGELLSRFTNDVNMMRNAMANTLIGLGKDTLTLIFLIFLMFYRDTTLALLAFFIFPTAVLPIIRIGKRMRKVTYHTQDELAILTNQLTQAFQGIRVVKAYGMEENESIRIESQIQKVFSLIYKSTRIRSASHPIIEILGGLAIISVIAYGGYQVMHHSRTTGDFISFIGALLMAYEPLKRLSNLNSNLQEGMAAAYRVFELLDTKPSIMSKNSDLNPTKSSKGHLIFEDVCFQYDNQKKNVLDHLSFEAKPGQMIAFVGASGAGKSTIINLIPRFYDITQGKILLDGKDIKEWSLTDLRRNIALVSQEISLFDRTIFENIAYGPGHFSNEEVINAAKAAAAHEFIEKLPQGYQTIVGENGVKLSGGQRQRISIARAMLKNAPLLLLDEATSALDTDSERQVQEALKILMKGRTTLVVAHRLSTIIEADLIYVLHHGKVIEKGSHQELLTHNGAYAKLWKAQSQK